MLKIKFHGHFTQYAPANGCPNAPATPTSIFKKAANKA